MFFLRFAYGLRSDDLPHCIKWIELGLETFYLIDVILTFFVGVPSSVAGKIEALKD